MGKTDIGLIGLAVMGQNLVLNIERNGFTVSVYNRTSEKTQEFINEKCNNKNIIPFYSLKDFVESLSKPRKIILMVKAGKPVDDIINGLLPFLEKGDILLDCGNSYFKDTERRYSELKEKGIYFIGCGISGGEYGALYGPSIMPGGDYDTWLKTENILLKISAKSDDGPCCSYIGKTSSGHFVKMVHNGIEYAIMQIIAEIYDIINQCLKMKNNDIQKIFEKWNTGKLNSYLIEITSEIFKKIDAETGKSLVDVILDKAEQKGTGKWTSQVSFDLGVPVPTITNAVEARIISGYKDYRIKISENKKSENKLDIKNKKIFIKKLENACYAAILITYSQGMHLLKVASDNFGYGLNLSEISRIWKGGCIIRSKILDFLKNIYIENSDIPHLFFSELFMKNLEKNIKDLREIICVIKKKQIPLLCISSALDYYDSFTRARLPANLIQAQRDYFGAHTYERIDKDGIFHTKWSEEIES